VLENQYAGMLRRHEVDGLVFLGHRLPDSLSGLIAECGGIAPVVNGCEYSPDLAVSSVHIDNAAAGSDATEHLIGLGHRRIGVVTGPLLSPISRDRLAGVRAAVARHGSRARLHIRHGDFSVESGFEAAHALLGERVSAIFCFSDEMALGALQAVRLRGLSCPKDVSVVGFDDIRFARYTTPSLTTIYQPAAEIGRFTVALLLKAIAGKMKGIEIITLPHQLVVRESSGPVPA
jgi:LacI family repressor for deo operon, udp, cdd, tsx, nupC, and nupG